MSTPLAHVTADGAEHALLEHLEQVAKLAAAFAEPFGGGAQGELAGLLHDFGKYAADFQDKLRAAQRLAAAEAHLEREDEIRAKSRVDHSSAGALLAVRRGGMDALPIAFAIAGHHAGLADWTKFGDRMEERGKRRLEVTMAAAPPAAILDHRIPKLPPPLVPASERDHASFRRLEMFTRMIFSALCDADFLDTEAFFDRSRAALRGGHIGLDALAARLRAHVDALSGRDTEVNRVRSEVRAACLDASSRPPGVFTLTVPTGGGKTFAAMEFALAHAERHGLRRVVVAIPYTSIIEQNAAKYREAFGLTDDDTSILEHHSSIDPKKDTPKNRLAAENWDAPVVVTTNVQLLESLFANRPARCRKLHNLARSVIVLDEAQTLPRDLLAATVDALGALARDYGSTLVLSTATQPALARDVLGDCGFDETTEIIPDPRTLAERLRRVEVDWSAAREPVTWSALAERLAAEPDVLAIVHRRADARDLCLELDRVLGDASTLHLSALMCPAHRKEQLAKIHERKARGEPVRLVATQLVEAGVDLDFPVVHRALAGLDSLAQAAGRCNREGKLEGRGRLHVFRAPTAPPPGILTQALEIAELMLAAGPIDLFDPDTHRAYFERLYRARGDVRHDPWELQPKRARLELETVARLYADKLIEDDWSAPIVVPFDHDAEKAIAALEKHGPSRDTLRALGRFTVNVARKDRDRWVAEGSARPIGEETAYVLAGRGAYDPRFGLRLESVGTLAPADSIV